jgi:transcriptional regulator with XRE-family HTH domain
MAQRHELDDGAVLVDLGRRLAQLRLDRNVTQRELAAVAGVSLPTVQRLEGGRGATLTALTRVLRAFDLSQRLEVLVPEPQPGASEQPGRRGARQRAAGAHTKPRRAQPEAPSWARSAVTATSASPWTTGRVSPPSAGFDEDTGRPIAATERLDLPPE